QARSGEGTRWAAAAPGHPHLGLGRHTRHNDTRMIVSRATVRRTPAQPPPAWHRHGCSRWLSQLRKLREKSTPEITHTDQEIHYRDEAAIYFDIKSLIVPLGYVPDSTTPSSALN